MVGTDFVEYANGVVGQVFSSPVAAAWFQAIGSLVTLLAASLIPWLRGRARQRAFLLRARILVQTARINIVRLEQSVLKVGLLKDMHYEINRLADEFTTFPVEELSRDAATSFHSCRLAFLNIDLTIQRLSNADALLPPRPRMNILRSIMLFLNGYEKSGRIFMPKSGQNAKPSKTEQAIDRILEGRRPEFEREWTESKTAPTEQPAL